MDDKSLWTENVPAADDSQAEQAGDAAQAQTPAPITEEPQEKKPKRTPLQWTLEILSYAVLIGLVLAAVVTRNVPLTVIAFVYLFFFYFGPDILKRIQKNQEKQSEKDAAYQPAFSDEVRGEETDAAMASGESTAPADSADGDLLSDLPTADALAEEFRSE